MVSHSGGGASVQLASLRTLESRIREGGDPREVMVELCERDAPHLKRLCKRWMRTHAYFLDLTHLYACTVAWASVQAAEYEGEVPIEQWMEDRVQNAGNMLLQKDLFAEIGNDPPDEPLLEHHSVLRTLFRLPDSQARKACIILNNLPDEERHTFYALVIDRRRVAEYAKKTGTPKAKALATLERVLRTIKADVNRPLDARWRDQE